MLQAIECKFSVSLEVKKLWEELREQGKEEEFETQFWKTMKGIINKQTLQRRNREAMHVTIEKRTGDTQDYVYIQMVEKNNR